MRRSHVGTHLMTPQYVGVSLEIPRGRDRRRGMSWYMLIIVISVVVFSLFDEALMGVLIFMRDDTPRMAFSPIRCPWTVNF